MEILNLLYGISTIVFLFLFFILLRVYFKLKLEQDLWYAFYFLCIGVPLIPFLWIPITPANSPQVLMILNISNISLFFMFLVLNIFIDLTTDEKISHSLFFLGILIGFLSGMIIIGDLAFLRWNNTVLGPIPVVDYVGIGEDIFLIFFLIYVYTFIRFGVVGIRAYRKIEKKYKKSQRRKKEFTQKHKNNIEKEKKNINKNINKNNKHEKKNGKSIPDSAPAFMRSPQKVKEQNENLEFKKRFVIYNLMALFVWLILSLTKKFFYNSLMGFDTLISAIIYIALIRTYYQNRESFHFFPGTLEMLIVNHKNGAHIVDYSFLNRRYQSYYKQDDGDSKLLRNALFGAISVFGSSLPNKGFEDDKIQNISFQEAQIIVYYSENLQWVLVSSKNSEMYHYLMKLISKRIEKDYKKEIDQIAGGLVPPESLVKGIIKKWKNIT